MDFRALKIEAKEALIGNRLMFLLVILVAGVLASVVPPLAFIVSPILMMGVFVVGKQILKEKKVAFEPIFTYFRDLEHALKIFVVNLLVGLIVMVGLILFIIPGIIFALRYSQAVLIISENKDMDIMDALKESRRMMQGYKMNFFIFILSFIGHYLLGVITFGIYLLYALPYIQLSMYNYYLNLKEVKGSSSKPMDAELA